MPKRDKHSLSHYKLLTCKPGELVPVGCVEVLPGDTFQQHSSVLLRCSPLLAPVMHPVQVRLHHFFVPTRLIDDTFDDFITGATATARPTLTASSGRADGDLLDHLGVPPVNSTTPFSAYPVRVYNKIYNEFYRDQDLVTEVAQDALNVHKVAWGKDYFTAARPFAQKGGTVTLPLGTSAPIKTQASDTVSGAQQAMNWKRAADGANPGAFHLQTNAGGGTTYDAVAGGAGGGSLYPSNLYADLATAAGVDVRSVRLALALQRYGENRARYGSRYTEYLRLLGVRSSDARLDRPEYLGGGKQTISFSEVLQTAEGTNAVGTMRGHGISGLRTGRYRRFFEEHGFVMTLLSVRPKSIYVSALNKMWSRTTKEDYWQKELEFIGQQPVLNKEVDFRNDGNDGAVFGYSDRYQEYREHPSMVHGDFRSSLLNFYHLGRVFASRPALNQAFVDCDPATRIFAVPTNDTLWVAVNHHIAARRLVSRSAAGRII